MPLLSAGISDEEMGNSYRRVGGNIRLWRADKTNKVVGRLDEARTCAHVREGNNGYLGKRDVHNMLQPCAHVREGNSRPVRVL